MPAWGWGPELEAGAPPRTAEEITPTKVETPAGRGGQPRQGIQHKD
jgi:hypothetical protein